MESWKVWAIRLVIFVGIPLLCVGVLYLTGNLDKAWDRATEKYSSMSVLAIVMLVILLLLDVSKDFISGAIFNAMFPSPTEKKLSEIHETTQQINEISQQTHQMLKNREFDPRNIKQHLDKLPLNATTQIKEQQIQNWYDQDQIDLKTKESLIFSVRDTEKLLTENQEKIAKTKNEPCKSALQILDNAVKTKQTKKITENYFAYTQQQKKQNLQLLKRSLDTAKQLFAFDESITLYKELIKLEPNEKNYSNLAHYLQAQNYFDDAIHYYQTALEMYRKLAKDNPSVYQPDVATTLNNLAILYSNKNAYTQALESYQAALQIRRKLAKDHPSVYQPDVAMTLNNLANLYSNKNENKQALESYQETLQIRRELAKSNPSVYQPYVANTLNNLAVLYFNKNEHKQALKSYQEALQLYRRLAKENLNVYQPYVATTLHNLALLYSDKNENKQALKSYQEALQIRRELAKENPSVYQPDVANTLNNLANLYSDKNENKQALENYQEALQLYRELTKDNPKVYGIDYANTLVMGSYLFNQDEEELTMAKEILEKFPHVPRATRLLEIIEGLEEKSKK